MYGLVNRSIQCFVEDTYGRMVWERIVRDAGSEIVDFEAMLTYEDDLTGQVIEAAARHLSRDRSALLEDLGSYLVTHEHMDSVRRLLRFGGHTFEDFLQSLDDLHDRVKLAVPDLELPFLTLEQQSQESYTVSCRFPEPGYGAVLLGMLRALADDYGVLVLLDMEDANDGEAEYELLKVNLLETSFASGRSFSLATEMAVK